MNTDAQNRRFMRAKRRELIKLKARGVSARVLWEAAYTECNEWCKGGNEALTERARRGESAASIAADIMAKGCTAGTVLEMFRRQLVLVYGQKEANKAYNDHARKIGVPPLRASKQDLIEWTKKQLRAGNRLLVFTEKTKRSKKGASARKAFQN